MKSAKLAFIPPNKGAIPTSKDTVAVLGMAKTVTNRKIQRN